MHTPQDYAPRMFYPKEHKGHVCVCLNACIRREQMYLLEVTGEDALIPTAATGVWRLAAMA